MSENVGALSSRNPKGLHGLHRENFIFLHEINAYKPGCVCLFARFILKTSRWILMKFRMVIMPLEATPNSNFNIFSSSLLVLQPCVVLAYSMVLWRFHNSKFLWVEVISPMPNPHLEDQGLHFIWPLYFVLSGIGGLALLPA
jgi:hypothetical protein